MKKNFIIALACLLPLAASCEKQNSLQGRLSEEGEIVISLDINSDQGLKASHASLSKDYETSVNKVQVLVFSTLTGRLDKYVNAGKTVKDIKMNVSTGDKTVWAVINGPDMSTISTVSALKDAAISLGSDNSINVSEGFVMAGSATMNVKSSSSSCVVPVSRLVSRVVLGSVRNSLPSAYGTLSVKSVFLSNVVSNRTVGGNAGSIVWNNKYGRADESPQVASHIIDGVSYMASCPDMTFRNVAKSVANGVSVDFDAPYLLYTMPNNQQTALQPFSTEYTPQRTAMIVTVEISGKTYYYPIPLDAAVLEGNKSYSVSLNILAPGSEDPSKPVVKTDCGVSIEVVGWAGGTDYDISI